MSSTQITKVNHCSDFWQWEIQNLDLHFKWSNQSWGIGELFSDLFEAGRGTMNHSLWRLHITANNGSNLLLGIRLEKFLDPEKTKDCRHFTGSLKCRYDIDLGRGIGKPCFLNVTKALYNHPYNLEDDKMNEYVYTEVAPLKLLHVNNNQLFPENTLSISFKMVLVFEPVNTKLRIFKSTDSVTENSEELLSKSYSRLLRGKTFSDLIIECGDCVFQVHKAILSARSSVFAKMLESGMSESVQNRIILNDMEPETIQKMLEYIYAGILNVPEIDDRINLMRLLDCAEKYDLQGLKIACFQKMFSNVTDENVAEIVLAAYNYNADPENMEILRNYCMTRHPHLIMNPEYKDLYFKHSRAFIG